MARLHVIFFDNTLCHVSCLLKVGVTQILLAMIEQGRVVPSLILDDPLRALVAWSHDPSLRSRARLISGTRYTAVDMQEALHENARRFVSAGRADGIVPRVREILDRWAETIELLRQRDFSALASRLDWVLKRSILERAMSRRGLAWGSPETKHLDHVYGSLELREGLYWACERSGLVQTVVSPAGIERFVHEPPHDTRAWLRAQVLRRAGNTTIDDVDWDTIKLAFRSSGRGPWPAYRYYRLPMDNPLRFTREECDPVFQQAGSFEEALECLGAEERDLWGRPVRCDPEGIAAPLPLPSPDDAGTGGKTDNLVPAGEADADRVGREDARQICSEGGEKHGAPRKKS